MVFCIAAVALLSLATTASGAVTAETNYNPVTITVSSAPFDILATPITPDAPYPQAEFQCNVTGDTRYPAYATGTFPLNVSVPVGQRVRVIFANGNLNGATVTQQGEPGVIVQQGGSPIVQQAGGASPIVQEVGSPIVQQTVSSPAATVMQQSPTVVQPSPSWQPAPTVPVAPQVVYVPSPVIQQPTTTTTPATNPVPSTTSTPTPATTTTLAAPKTPAANPPAAPTTMDAPPPTPTTADTSLTIETTGTPAPAAGRKLLQDTVPGGPNNGLVEYVALASANSVSGFYAGSTQFGVPYVEFTATEAVRGYVASFKGVLEVAQVVGGVPLYPFQPNPSLSPECQVNVNFMVA